MNDRIQSVEQADYFFSVGYIRPHDFMVSSGIGPGVPKEKRRFVPVPEPFGKNTADTAPRAGYSNLGNSLFLVRNPFPCLIFPADSQAMNSG